MIANIMYSALVACLVEVFLVINVSMIADFAQENQWNNALLSMVYTSDVIIVLGYVLLGIVILR